MSNDEYVFVYGRLRAGFWKGFLLGQQKPLGTAHTVQEYALYVSKIPYVRMDQAVSPICGEVYPLTPRVLRDLDSLMAHPKWYQRHRVAVVLEDGTTMEAWMYARRGMGGVSVKSGDLLNRGTSPANSE
ncbi:MAG: gamma-glutamylcyclotransferase family protein [Candidatus Hydrogenedentota bacterium]